MAQEKYTERFDAPVAGQSLTDTPGNYPWEHPSQFSTVDKASEYIWDKLHETQMAEQVITMLKNDVPVEALARMILFGGFTEGKWNPDLAILLAEIVFKQILAMGMKLKIKNIKLFMGDQSNNKFHKNFAEFKSLKDKATASATPENKAEQFAEEIKAELEAQEPSGLMTQEDK